MHSESIARCKHHMQEKLVCRHVAPLGQIITIELICYVNFNSTRILFCAQPYSVLIRTYVNILLSFFYISLFQSSRMSFKNEFLLLYISKHISQIVNGGWSDWSKYGTCSKICGGGIYYRSRTCDNPSPAHGGTDCTGSGTDNAPCNTQNCPSKLDFNFDSMKKIVIVCF